MTWQQIAMRAQRHGWVVCWISDSLIVMRRAFYRRDVKPCDLFVFYDGRLRTGK